GRRAAGAAARDGARCQEGRAGKTATGTDRRVYRPRHTKVAAKPPQARQYTFFEMFFWGPPSLQPTYGNQPQNSQLPAYAQQGGQHQYQPAYTQQAGRQRYYQGPTNGAAQTSQHTYSSAPGTTPY
ncbi:MAG: hypothetical protein WA710_17400, partial [Pseudolabrys sp.]